MLFGDENHDINSWLACELNVFFMQIYVEKVFPLYLKQHLIKERIKKHLKQVEKLFFFAKLGIFSEFWHFQ